MLRPARHGGDPPLGVGLYPHAKTVFSPQMQVASLDHALWFHRGDIRADQWLLYHQDSPAAAGARASGTNISTVVIDEISSGVAPSTGDRWWRK